MILNNDTIRSTVAQIYVESWPHIAFTSSRNAIALQTATKPLKDEKLSIWVG